MKDTALNKCHGIKRTYPANKALPKEYRGMNDKSWKHDHNRKSRRFNKQQLKLDGNSIHYKI